MMKWLTSDCVELRCCCC